LFGSVTSSDIVDAVNRQSGVELERRRLVIDDAIKTLGTHEVGVRLHPEVEFRLTLEVASSN
jgi:large subunit ribosomal protein L9